MAAKSTKTEAPKTSRKSEARWLNPREMKAWRSYVMTERRLMEALDGDLDPHDLSLADYEVLVIVSEAPDRMIRMTDLADAAMLSKSRLSHRMKVMEKAGWIKRQACETDRRGSWAVMTEKGWKTLVKAAPDHTESIRNRFIDHLTVKDQEDLARIFDRVHSQLREQFISGE
jgi:DNA-binding MarR family transcriptional regulator